jgi:hypothetical protein
LWWAAFTRPVLRLLCGSGRGQCVHWGSQRHSERHSGAALLNTFVALLTAGLRGFYKYEV